MRNIMLLMAVFLTACSSPPKPKEPSGSLMPVHALQQQWNERTRPAEEGLSMEEQNITVKPWRRWFGND